MLSLTNRASVEAIQCCFRLDTHVSGELGDMGHFCEESNSRSTDPVAFAERPPQMFQNVAVEISIDYLDLRDEFSMHNTTDSEKAMCMLLHDKIAGCSIHMITKTQISQL